MESVCLQERRQHLFRAMATDYVFDIVELVAILVDVGFHDVGNTARVVNTRPCVLSNFHLIADFVHDADVLATHGTSRQTATVG